MSTYNPASDADLDRRYVDELDAAEAVLARYCDVESLRPTHLVSLDAIVRQRAEAHPQLDHTSSHDLTLVMSRLRNTLKERAVAPMTRLDRVHLDLAGEHGTRAWAADVPAIVFCSLTSQDTLFNAGRQQALAVWFDPTCAGFVTAKARSGELYTKPNVYAPDGYVAIVGSFASIEDAVEAREELNRAVLTISTTSSALVDDELHHEEDEPMPSAWDLDVL